MPSKEAILAFFTDLQCAGLTAPPTFVADRTAQLWARPLKSLSDADMRAAVVLWLCSERARFWPVEPMVILEMVRATRDGQPDQEEMLALAEKRLQLGIYVLLHGHLPERLKAALHPDPQVEARLQEAIRQSGGWAEWAEAKPDALPHRRREFRAAIERMDERARSDVAGTLFEQSVQRIEQRQTQRAVTEQGADAAKIVSQLAEKMGGSDGKN